MLRKLDLKILENVKTISQKTYVCANNKKANINIKNCKSYGSILIISDF